MTPTAQGSYEPHGAAAAGLEAYGGGASAGAGAGAERPVTVPRQGTAPHVPAQDAARGEHTHSEPPIPPARPVVQRSSVRGQILDALRTALVTGDLLPGEVYSAPALGDRFGVSATPVREAMQQLALEGAVEVVPNRGFRVVERGARELAELAEIRGLLEAPVIMRLARTVPRERWAELRPLAEAGVRAAASGCRATYAEADRAFHGALLGFAGNGQLVQLAEDLHRRAQQGYGDPTADAAGHVRLVDALVVGDVETVRLLVEEHFGG
ncbi:GntR family transcriptional regulator [Streptomyces sp. S6]